MADPQTIDKILRLLREDKETVSRDFVAIIKAILEVVKRREQITQKEVKTIQNFVLNLQGRIKKDSEELLSQAYSKLDKRVSQIKDGYTPVKGVDYFDGDDANINEIIKEVLKLIPPLPEVKDYTEDLKSIKEEIEALKKRPIGSGGGVTNLRIQQAFKYILKTEEPVGDIDGANTEYTVSQPIFAVLAFSLNGEVIAQLPNYTISGNKITFSSALPAAYSGKDFECKYI